MSLVLSPRRHWVVTRSGAASVPVGSDQEAAQPVRHHPPQRYKPGNPSPCSFSAKSENQSDCNRNQMPLDGWNVPTNPSGHVWNVVREHSRSTHWAEHFQMFQKEYCNRSTNFDESAPLSLSHNPYGKISEPIQCAIILKSHALKKYYFLFHF